MTGGGRVVLLGWGNALPSQLVVYERLYRSFGLVSTSAVADTTAGLTDPGAYARAVAPIVEVLVREQREDPRPVIVHLFSDNGFTSWASLLEQLAQTEEGRRARDAIRGVILDCAPGLWNVRGPVDFARRFARAMTPAIARRTRLGPREHVPVLSPLLTVTFLGFQALFPRSVKRMLSSGARVGEHQPRCPQLFVYAEGDTIVPPLDVRAWMAKQRAAGIEVDDEPFPDAKHVACFPKDPRRYKKTIGAFVTRVLAVATVLAFLGLALTGCRRKKADAASVREPAAAGGAEVDDGDAGDSLVEDARRYPVKTWSFALDRYDMTIEDVGLTTALDSVLERSGAELVVNGGFFDPQGKALGLAVSDGAVLSRLAVSASGGVLTSDGERAHLWETESFAMPDPTRFAIQCRPRLVVDGAPNVKRDDGQRSERTALCVRDGGKTVEVVIVRPDNGEAAGPSLYSLGRFLARRGCEGALNLDGGPSTGLAWRENGTVMRLLPHRPVRHAVLFKARTR